MDLLCPKCAEPIDNDELHQYALATCEPYSSVAEAFRTHGCSAIGFNHNPTGYVDPRISITYSLLGDDMDGAASILEDMPLHYQEEI